MGENRYWTFKKEQNNLLEAMVQFFQQISPIATPIAIISVILMVVFYLRGKRVRKPTYFIKSNNLVTGFSKKLDKLQLLYGKTSIENLTVSKIAFWNGGAETIEASNIVEADPLRIEAGDDCDILDAYIIQENNKANKFQIELVNSKLVKILFDYLEKREGGVIQVIHTGKESTDIKLEGLVKGAGKPQSSYSSDLLTKIIRKLPTSPKAKKESPTKQRRIFGIASLIYAIFLIIPIASEKSVTNLIVGIIFILFLSYCSYYMFKRRVPKGLEKGEEEEI